MTPAPLRDADYLLVGGGLQNALIALALRAHQPGARIAMVERGPAPGGNHTWCFHESDLEADARAWIAPLVAARWPGYDVAFPSARRRVELPYACVTSPGLAAAVARALDAPGSQLLTGTTALEVGADRAVVRDAAGAVAELRATAVIDARGPDRAPLDREAGREAGLACGWQKFLGRELRLAAPHGLDRPVLMDATLPQTDGFRFMYVLPLGPDRVLVEDTYVADGTRLDAAALRDEIDRYVAARGWTIAAVEREESGLLPLPWRCEPPAPQPPLLGGYAGGWFHPVTGYSFPIAARLAAVIARAPAAALFGAPLHALAAEHARQLRFALRLNRMLFRWFAPARRVHVLERFYRLPAPVIARFYALALTPLDRARILLGRPPRGLSLRAVLGGEAR